MADVFRFSRSTSAVVSQVMLPRTLSIMSYMIIGLIVARACGSDDVIYIMNKSVGMGAVVIVVAGEMVINCTNLYFSGLAIVSIFDMCGCHVPRPLVTIVCGVIGTAAGALGILKKFITFLEVLAVAFPPVAGIISCEYFIVKAFRCRLDEPWTAFVNMVCSTVSKSVQQLSHTKPIQVCSKAFSMKLKILGVFSLDSCKLRLRVPLWPIGRKCRANKHVYKSECESPELATSKQIENEQSLPTTQNRNIEETRSSGAVPELAPAIVPLSLFAWLAASLLGHFVKVGMPFLRLGICDIFKGHFFFPLNNCFFGVQQKQGIHCLVHHASIFLEIMGDSIFLNKI